MCMHCVCGHVNIKSVRVCVCMYYVCHYVWMCVHCEHEYHVCVHVWMDGSVGYCVYVCLGGWERVTANQADKSGGS